MLGNALKSFGLAIAVLYLTAGNVPAQNAKPTIPDSQGLAIMVRTTMLAFNQANLTGNYTVLRDLAAPSFADANTAADLARIFRTWRERNLDISPIVLYPPEFTVKPAITDNGLLHLEGHFPTRPLQVNFGILFQSVAGRWRLFGMEATTQ